MLARTLLRRLSSLHSCQNVLTKQMMVVPYTCRTTSMVRQISCTVCKLEDVESEQDEKKSKYTTDPKMEGIKGYMPRNVDVEESLRYMESEAYRDVYGDEPVWVPYRKNTKGNYYPPLRKTCIRAGAISTASPCPICRDDYLVLDYRNVKLLKQFLYEDTEMPRNIRQIGLCKKQMKKLELEVAKAQDYGYIEKYFPFRQYHYSYYKGTKKVTSRNNNTDHTSEEKSIEQTSSMTSSESTVEDGTMRKQAE